MSHEKKNIWTPAYGNESIYRDNYKQEHYYSNLAIHGCLFYLNQRLPPLASTVRFPALLNMNKNSSYIYSQYFT